MNNNVIEIYTDGSCHTDYNIGAWASILFVANERILIKDTAQNTTHNRMELLAVIKAIEFINKNHKNSFLKIFTDSQYVFRIPERMEKLKRNNFITKKGIPLQNNDLVQILIHQIENNTVEFIKVKAHQKTELDKINYNSEVDKIARQLVRDAVKQAH